MAFGWTEDRVVPLGKGYILVAGTLTDVANTGSNVDLQHIRKVSVFFAKVSNAARAFKCVKDTTYDYRVTVTAATNLDDGQYVAIGTVGEA